MHSFHLFPIRLRVATVVLLFSLLPAMSHADPQNTATGTGALPGNTGTNNTADGFDALNHDTSGGYNTASGANALYANTTGTGNTATGTNALHSNTTAGANSAFGFDALYFNTTGRQNTAVGNGALELNTSGIYNTAAGALALYSNTTGNYNTALGTHALYYNTSGGQNVAVGDFALIDNTGDSNTALGAYTLEANTTGFENVGVGSGALEQNTTGYGNVAIGGVSLASVTTTNGSVAIGYDALYNAHGQSNIAIGLSAGQYIVGDSSYNIEIGSYGANSDADTIRIGTQGTQTNTYIAGISGVPVSGAAVVVTSTGQLGVAGSSARFKDDVHDMSQASDALFSLRPVSFRYKPEIDPLGQPEFGLIAEEVEKVDPALVVHDKDGKPFTVRYEQVNAMLLNEFLKEHAAVRAQSAEIAALKAANDKLDAAFARQQAQFDALSASLREQAVPAPAPRPATGEGR